MDYPSVIRSSVERRAVFFSNHARVRLFERNISSKEILAVLNNSQVLEHYDDDIPCPSVLLKEVSEWETIHFVVAWVS